MKSDRIEYLERLVEAQNKSNDILRDCIGSLEKELEEVKSAYEERRKDDLMGCD